MALIGTNRTGDEVRCFGVDRKSPPKGQNVANDPFQASEPFDVGLDLQSPDRILGLMDDAANRVVAHYAQS
jgi:hypothetical protein